MKTTFKVTLSVSVDLTKYNPPAEWEWPDLLDSDPDDVKLLSCEETPSCTPTTNPLTSTALSAPSANNPPDQTPTSDLTGTAMTAPSL